MLRWLLVLLHRFSILRSLRGCRTSALLALLFIFLGVGNASAAVYGFRHVGVDAGLSNREVNSICVDAHGLVWICTPWGLDKYDGNNVTSFSTQADGLGSLALYNVQEFGNDTLVVRSEDGYLIFRRSTESFSRADDFLTSVGASVRLDGLWIDDGKNVWVYDKGRFFVTTQHGQTYDVPVATDYSRIATLAVVHGGVIVLFESGRLLRCVAPTDGCSPSPISMSSPLAGGANAMYVDSHNDFWAVNATGDTLWHRPQSGKKWTISLTSLDLDKSKHIVMNGIAEDVQGAIWISTVSDGLYVANRKAGALTHVGRDVSSPNGLRSNFCTCLTASRGVNQAVYVGYANAGFSVYDPRSLKFEKLSLQSQAARADMVDISCIATTGSNDVYVGTNGNGLWVINEDDLSARQAPFHPDGLVNDVTVMPSGQVWCAIAGVGLLSFDGDKTTYYAHTPNVPSCVASLDVMGLSSSDEGSLWVSAGNRLTCKLSGHDNWCQEYAFDRTIIHISALSRTRAMVVSPRNVYFATADGVRISVNQALLDESPNIVVDAKLDSRGLLWVAADDGLRVFARLDEEWKIINKWTYSEPPVDLYEDDRHDVLVASASHVTIISPTLNVPVAQRVADKNKSPEAKHQLPQYDFHSTTYSKACGLMDGSISRSSIVQVHSGAVWVGAEKGINVYRPHEVVHEVKLADVIFTALTLDGERVKAKDRVDGILSYNVNGDQISDIVLPDSCRNIRIDFCVPGSASPSGLTFVCRVSGTEHMEFKTNQPFIFFSQLKPGTYSINVSAYNAEGVSTYRFSEIDVEVVGEWWTDLKIWSLIAVLFLALCVWIIYRVLRSHINNGAISSHHGRSAAHAMAHADEVSIRRDILTGAATSIYKTIAPMVSQLRRAVEQKNLREQDVLRTKMLIDKLESASGLLQKMTTEKADEKLVSRQYLILQRHDFVQLVRAYSTNIINMVGGSINVSFASSEGTVVACYDENLMRKVITDIATSALAAASDNGFVNIWAGCRKEMPGKVVFMVTVGGATPSDDNRYFGSDVELQRIPQDISDIIALHKAVLFRMDRQDGCSTVLMVMHIV